MSHLKLTLFSGFHLTDCDGNTLSGNSRKSKALLAWLALNPDHEHPREKLAAILWPDSDETQARHSLRQALADLRKILPANSTLLHTTKDWILLDSKQIEVDALRFNQDLKENSKQSIDHAIRLYKGELLEGCNPRSDTFEDWLFDYRSNYSERAATIIDKRLSHLLADNNYEQASSLALQLLSIDPLRESAYRALMLSHFELNNHTIALKWYQRCKKILQKELDVSPAPETEALYKQITNNQQKTSVSKYKTVKKTQPLSNNTERLLYLVNMAIKGILEHNIGQSFLIRGHDSRKITISDEIIALTKSNDFFYCHKEVDTSNKGQKPLIELSQALTAYLFDEEELSHKKQTADQETFTLIQKISDDQPVLLFIEHIHNSNIDLQVLLAELISLIGNNAILLVMTSNVKNDPLGPTLQETTIGAPLTTINLD